MVCFTSFSLKKQFRQTWQTRETAHFKKGFCTGQLENKINFNIMSAWKKRFEKEKPDKSENKYNEYLFEYKAK